MYILDIIKSKFIQDIKVGDIRKIKVSNPFNNTTECEVKEIKEGYVLYDIINGLTNQSMEIKLFVSIYSIIIYRVKE